MLNNKTTARPVLRWYPHEFALVLLGFSMPLNSAATVVPLIGTTEAKMIALALVVFTILISAIFLRRRAQPLHRPAVITVLLLYTLTLVIATFTRSLPTDRIQLFVFFLIGVLSFYIAERFRPGAWLRITYVASLLHIVLAATTGHDHLAFIGVQRMTAGTSAVLLGFESVLVIIITFWYISRGMSKWLLIVVALSTYTLYSSFSRAAFVSLLFAAVIVYLFWAGGRGFFRAFCGIVFGFVGYVFVLPPLLAFLSAGEPESLYGASGRYYIWNVLLSHFDQWWRGYGFEALYKAGGPDNNLYLASNGLPIENALLQALLMGGIIAAALWGVFFLLAVFDLWKTRKLNHGLGFAMAAPLIVAAIYSVGQSGVSYDWWWLLSAFSLARIATINQTTVSPILGPVAGVRAPAWHSVGRSRGPRGSMGLVATDLGDADAQLIAPTRPGRSPHPSPPQG